MPDEREILSYELFGTAARELAELIAADGFRPDAIVGIARGGLPLAGALGYALDVKTLGSLNVEFYTGVDSTLDEPIVLPPTLDRESLRGKSILLVDDVADSGRTLHLVVELLRAGGGQVRTVCLYSKPTTVEEPDYVWRRTSRWIMFPWRLRGSGGVSGWAVPGMTVRPIAELIDPGWAKALEPVAPQIARMGDFLRDETAAGRPYLPAGQNVLRAFAAPLADVKVLIVGQDPYPTPGHPVGLSFSVDRGVRPVPRSLQNIYQELRTDLGIPTPPNGDLTPWTRQGVMLLNRVLTVQAGASGSHRGKGWEQITEHAIRALVARGGPLVAVLWGRDAGTLRPLLGGIPVIASAHPSPLSASAGFFGSRPFSRANELLVDAGAAPVDWSLPP